MKHSAFSTDSIKWWKWNKCDILKDVDGYDYIVCQESEMDTYYPFDYYREPVPEELINYILDRNGDSYKGVYLHHLFASLNCSDINQIKRWVEIFGPLNDPGNRIDTFMFYSEHDTFKKFIEAGETYRLLIGGRSIPDHELDWDDMIFDSVEDQLEYTFDSTRNYLSGISPVLVMKHKEPGKHPVLEWEWTVPGLLSALYFMLFLDLTTKGGPYKCANERCGNFFYPEDLRGGPQYCSPECQNRVNQRNNKDKKKKVRVLWREGKTKEEIAAATGIKMEQIATWINTFKR